MDFYGKSWVKNNCQSLNRSFQNLYKMIISNYKTKKSSDIQIRTMLTIQCLTE